MTNDQKHYDKLKAQIGDFLTALEEWEEQCYLETNANEKQCLIFAINDANRCLINLGRAKDRLAGYEKQQKEALLERIRTGTTTYTDATLAEGFMQ